MGGRRQRQAIKKEEKENDKYPMPMSEKLPVGFFDLS